MIHGAIVLGWNNEEGQARLRVRVPSFNFSAAREIEIPMSAGLEGYASRPESTGAEVIVVFFDYETTVCQQANGT